MWARVKSSGFQGVTVRNGRKRHLITANPLPDLSNSTAALCGKRPPGRSEWWLHNVTNPRHEDVCKRCEELASG